MSSPIDAAFEALWNEPDSGRRRYTLALIELTTPSALTLRYASSELTTPDNNTWQAGIETCSISQGIDFLGAGVSPAAATLRLTRRRDACQADGTKGNYNTDLPARYAFSNALVTVYFWIEGATLFSQAPQMFQGRVSRVVDADDSGMTLHMFQDQTWNKAFPKVIDKVSYPDSPDGAKGQVVPWMRGDATATPLPPPWASGYTDKRKQEDAGGAQGVLPLVVVDNGVGASQLKLLATGHPLSKLFDRASGMSAFIVGPDALDPLSDSGGGITETLGASESYLSIADEKLIAIHGVKPIDVRVGSNTALNPRRGMDPFNPRQWATLDQTAGQGVLQYVLPNLSPLGRIESVQVAVAFIGNAGNGNTLRINANTPGVGPGGGAAITGASTGTSPAWLIGTWPAAYWTQDWDFGGSSTIWDLRVDFSGGAINKASIIGAFLIVTYRPQRSVVVPGRVVTNVNAPRGRERRPDSPPVRFTVEEKLMLEGVFFGNFKGPVDDISGTLTGTGLGLIERPPDLMRDLLTNDAGISSANIETGSGAFGSFIDARAKLRNAQPYDFKMMAYQGERSTFQKMLQKMAEQSGMCVYQDRITNKWLAFVWKRGVVPDFYRTLSWVEGDFMAVPQVSQRSSLDSRARVRVKYLLDYWKSSTLAEAFVGPDSSGQGLNLPTVRDQRLEVVTGTNDTIDWTQGGVTRAATIAAGLRTPINLAADFRAALRAALGSNNIEMGYGFSIKTGFNNKLDFDVSGVNYVATLNEADYTAEGLAAEVVRAVNAAAPAGFSLTSGLYDHPSNTFTFVGSAAFRFDGTSGAANYATSAVHVLNDFAHGAAATSWTSLTRRYGERFWFAAPGGSSFNVLWKTGANATKNAAELLGYPRLDTGLTLDNPATYSRGDRERLSDDIEAVYGPREEDQLIADWIRDENSAVEWRNRRFDLTSAPPVDVVWQSNRMLGVRPFNVVPFSSDVDRACSFIRYGSDGSWAGKNILVLEVLQNAGPSYTTEIKAVEIT